jgi:hypothetical protein
MEINKYQNGKIYQIVSFSHPDLIYYGSTIQTLSMRFAGHRRDTKKENSNSSKQIICFDDAKILLIENYPCNSKEELNKREGEYIRNNICVNKRIEGRTKEEYYEDNKELIKEKNKEYYEGNREKIKENSKIYNDNNKEKITEKQKIYRDNNREKIKETNNQNKGKQQIYYEVNKENIKEHNKIYRENNTDIIKENGKIYHSNKNAVLFKSSLFLHG